MQIACGSTRVVLLAGDKAVKIARFRPIRFLLRMLMIAFSRKKRLHFFEKYGPVFIHAVYNDIFAGVIANRNEYSYYIERMDRRVMPSLGQYLGGLIVTQVRGTPVSLHELDTEDPFAGLVTNSACEVSDPKQFCRHPAGQLVLVDYGRVETQDLLRTAIL